MGDAKQPLVVSTGKGLYCPQGDFYIDPWKKVERAVITHAHSDHARPGSKKYLTAQDGLRVLQARLGKKAQIETLQYGEPVTISGVKVSLHSAGHVLGSAQVRIEHQGRIWVASGDYKTSFDATCAPFETVRCHCFITESTFGLPIYRWQDPRVIGSEMNAWWQENQRCGRNSVLYAYSFGKAQRLLSLLDPSIGTIYVHSAIAKMNNEYIASGINLPECKSIDDFDYAAGPAMIITPPSAAEPVWMSAGGEFACGFASGWMQIRSNRDERIYDRSFVLSDHADWNELLQVIKNTGAEEVVVTHGYVQPLVRYLNEQGIKSRSFRTPYSGESGMNSSENEEN